MKIYDFTVKNRKGEDVSLENFKGKVLLIVNTATRCGFTPQYDELEALYSKYNKDGFEVLDFPCNQFGNQAPESDEEIHTFCQLNYKVKFDQFAKVEVNGENAIPLFKYLKEQKGFGINRSEIFTREGHSPSVKFPRILGIECVGEVEETTSPSLKKGQKIVSIM